MIGRRLSAAVRVGGLIAACLVTAAWIVTWFAGGWSVGTHRASDRSHWFVTIDHGAAILRHQWITGTLGPDHSFRVSEPGEIVALEPAGAEVARFPISDDYWLRPSRAVPDRVGDRYSYPNAGDAGDAPLTLGYTLMSFPLWIPVALAWLLPLVVGVCGGVRRELETRRFLAGCCLSCGYDLSGNESNVCPECGTRIRGKRESPGAHVR